MTVHASVSIINKDVGCHGELCDSVVFVIEFLLTIIIVALHFCMICAFCVI